MKPKTREFLNLLLWSADMLARPTFRNLSGSYEEWAYRQGLFRQAVSLENQRLIERKTGNSEDRLYRLTAEGRLAALGGRDPEKQWSRTWDGLWRLVLFDVPMERHADRGKLRRYLHRRGFGCLQGSVWITPDPMERERDILGGKRGDVGSLILMNARPCSGERDSDIVAAAWNFEAINRGYAKHMKVLSRFPEAPLKNHAAALALQKWAAEERAAWFASVELDPLLPKQLLPDEYLGRTAWQQRKAVLSRAKERLWEFRRDEG